MQICKYACIHICMYQSIQVCMNEEHMEWFKKKKSVFANVAHPEKNNNNCFPTSNLVWKYLNYFIFHHTIPLLKIK